MLVNLERDPRDFRNFGILHAGVRYCAAPRKPGEKIMALTVKLSTRPSMWEDVFAAINFLTLYKASTLYVVDGAEIDQAESEDRLDVTISFCLCGPYFNMTCPVGPQLSG